MRETYDQVRKLDDTSGESGFGNRSSGFLSSVFGKDLGGALATSGIFRELGSSLTGAATVGLESAVGQPMATFLNSTLSGVVSGASAGAIAGLPAQPSVRWLAVQPALSAAVPRFLSSRMTPSKAMSRRLMTPLPRSKRMRSLPAPRLQAAGNRH